MSKQPIEVLIIGAGMYVCGRGTEGYGTILPCVMQAYRDGVVRRIMVTGTQETSIRFLNQQLENLNQQLGLQVEIEGFPKEDIDPEVYRKALAQLGPRGCVIVAVPDHLHGPIVRDVLEANRPVLVVKPFTPTVEEGQELCQLAQAKNLYGVVEFHKRWDLANRKLQEVLEAQRLGIPLYALVEFSQRKRVPQDIFGGWAEQTNVFQYLGVHYVDLLAHMFKATPMRAMAVGQFAYLQGCAKQTQDSIQAIVEWAIPGSDTPFASTFLVNWVDPNSSSAMSYQSIKVVGTKGRYESDQKYRGQQLVTDEDGIEDINPYFSQSYSLGKNGRKEYLGYGLESIRTFLDDVQALLEKKVTLEELRKTRPTFQQALISTAVTEAVVQSLRCHSDWIPIPQVPEMFAFTS